MDTAQDSKGLIRDHVYARLKKDIMELKLEPGRLISEKEAIEMLQVSRSPIREAFVRLAQEGLIETVPQKGSFISLIDLRHVEESRFVRETLEAAVVREACERLGPEQLLHLQNLLGLQELAASEGNFTRLFGLDEAFHHSIVTGSGKSRTWSLMQQFSTHYHRIRLLRLASNTDWQTIISQHHDIVRAIREKDPDTAETVMRRHLNRVVVEKEELMQKYPGYFIT
jgi:DNA-binding GntR family transcriptional regulator